jgi:hypothetical protein
VDADKALSWWDWKYEKLLKYDGTFWKEIDYGNVWADDKISTFAEFQGNLYFGTVANIYRYDEVHETGTVVQELMKCVWAFAEHGGKLYAAVGDEYNRDPGFIPPNTSNPLWWFARYYYETLGLQDREHDAELWSSEDGDHWTKVCDIDEDAAMSACPYKGRLYVGTGTQEPRVSGRLYVSGYQSTGYLVSVPYSTDDGGPSGTHWVDYGTLAFDWEAVQNTHVCFQIRTAETVNGLSSKEFVGPDGTPESVYDKPEGTEIPAMHNDEHWIQYMAYLSTDDPDNSTPVLYSVSITYTPPEGE